MKEDQSEAVKLAAAEALSLRFNDTSATRFLIHALLESSEPINRHYAALALEKRPQQTPETRQALEQTRGDSYKYVTRVAEAALAD